MVPETIEIDSVLLKFYVMECIDYEVCSLFVVTTEWDSSVTWNSCKQGVAWNTPGGDYDPQQFIQKEFTSGTQLWEGFNVTPFVKKFIEGEPNYGFLITISYEEELYPNFRKYPSSEFADESLRPKLVIVSDDIPDTEVPVVKITSPDGGDTLEQGSMHDITWKATDNVGVVSRAIYFSSDNGTAWTPVDSAAGNTGTYSWTVPDVESNNCLIRIFAYDSAGNSGNTISDAFTITPPTGIIPNSFKITDAGSYRVTVVNIQGRVVASFDTKDLGQISKSLCSGIHFINITTSDKKLVKKYWIVK